MSWLFINVAANVSENVVQNLCTNNWNTLGDTNACRARFMYQDIYRYTLRDIYKLSLTNLLHSQHKCPIAIECGLWSSIVYHGNSSEKYLVVLKKTHLLNYYRPLNFVIYSQQSYTAYRSQSYSYCCSGYGTSTCHGKNPSSLQAHKLIIFVYISALCSGITSCPNGGTCTAPNTCVCQAGWSGPTCTTGTNKWLHKTI